MELTDLLSQPLAADPLVVRGASMPEALRDECLADILVATAHRRPEHPALIFGSRTVTYRELNAESTAVAAGLAQLGVAAGQIAGLFMPRGADLLIAQAGITRSGAAWLPLDADTPLDRVKVCLRSAGAVGLVTTREWLPRLADFPLPVWAVEDLAVANPAPVPPPSARPEDLAYVIFTSGSTGEPKGIAITQRNICHLLRSENALVGVRETDRVYQGFSLAFDMSFEEIWISWLVGATVWIAPASLTADADGIAAAINGEGITVLHAVPTLMSLVTDPLPGVRLINLGGEACPYALAQRLIRPGRVVLNSYGPTETTVTATLVELKAGQPITIGGPLPNYGLLVVDEQHRPLAAGETGELCIFGPGLAPGYLNRPELTADRFVPNPMAVNAAEALMYRSGDLARVDAAGAVHCLGRVDNQVKIRGFRVELDEISAALSDQPGVAAAAVVVRPIAETDQVVAFVIPAVGHVVEVSQLRHAMAARLPPYMVPAHFEVVEALPRLASGKINSRALRELPLQIVLPDAKVVAATPEEQALYDALAKLFPVADLRPEADFFTDLGGHSLLAARLVSVLRTDPRYAALSVQDVYRERRLSGIADSMRRVHAQNAEIEALTARIEISRDRHFLCGLAQAAVIPVFIMLHIAEWLAPFFVYHYLTGDPGDSIPRAVGYSLAAFVLTLIANFAIAIVGKRALAGRIRPGTYPLWGITYFRWWLGGKFTALPDMYLLASTPWMPVYLRALGARIGRYVIIDAITVSVPELLTVGDGVSLGTLVNLENARVEGGQLHVGTVTIGREAVIDSAAVLENDTVVGERARLKGQSALSAGRSIPAGQVWEGAPARDSGQSALALPAREKISTAQRGLLAVIAALTSLAVAVLFFLPTFPAFMLIDWVDSHTLDIFDSQRSALTSFGLLFLLAIPASTVFVGLTMLVAGGARRLLPVQRAGTFSVYSFEFWQKRLMSLVLDNSLRVLHGLYASVYASTWLRLLGATVGRHAEVSTAEGMVPELLTLGDDCFVADGAVLGDEEVSGGWMILQPTAVGSRSFIGNGSYVPDGAMVPDDVLIGVQTKTPDNEHLAPGQTWIGSPPILLPARERVEGFPEWLTFRPSTRRRVARGIVEGMRIVMPLALIIAAGYLIIVLIMPLAERVGWGVQVGAALALAGLLYGLASFLLVVVLKWLLIGRYRPHAVPMWTPFVWTSEAITNLYESLAVPNFLDILLGTPMLPWAMTLLGVRVGSRVWLNTTDITEYDCVSIGDEAELNAFCGPQTHLFEDRIMKIGHVSIGARVTVGARSIILYDTHVGDGARLGPLTLVAKGERLPPDTAWDGAPATPRSTRGAKALPATR
jgi:non-ribosomal peptide synthetase-like protein